MFAFYIRPTLTSDSAQFPSIKILDGSENETGNEIYGTRHYPSDIFMGSIELLDFYVLTWPEVKVVCLAIDSKASDEWEIEVIHIF